jgi:hypothetical protein
MPGSPSTVSRHAPGLAALSYTGAGLPDLTWPSPRSGIKAGSSQLPLRTPDPYATISLRCCGTPRPRAAKAALISVQMAEYFTETGRTPADIRAEFLSGRQQPFSIDEVLRRGIERGEIDPDRLTPRIATVALDLLRHEMLMTLQPVPEETITEIVDEIFLPLVRKEP